MGAESFIPAKNLYGELCRYFQLTGEPVGKIVYIHPDTFHNPPVDNYVENVDKPCGKRVFSPGRGCGKLGEKSA